MSEDMYFYVFLLAVAAPVVAALVAMLLGVFGGPPDLSGEEDEHARMVRPAPGLPHHRRSATNHEDRIVRPDTRITE